MKKVIHPCDVKGYDHRFHKVFCSIEYNDGRLSITGVIGPRQSGNAYGGGGQIDGEFMHRNPDDNDSRTYQPYEVGTDMRLAKDWTTEMWYHFLEVWDEWHLNDMQSCCEHQKALGWHKERIDPNKGREAYGKHYPGQTQDSWNMKIWAYPPHGYMLATCPECGHRCGGKWLTVAVPDAVIEFLASLPDTDITPAWV
jgi:hypothetical protein